MAAWDMERLAQRWMGHVRRGLTAVCTVAVGLGFVPGLMVPVQAETANAPSDTVVVLDASGSMWGQIDGVAKIEIARDVLGELLADWPQNHRLGLTAYGHRREGDCGDIETLIDIGSVDAASFKAALGGIQPKGKTPLSAAVRQAAADLAHTERPATVILVSDGLENCDLDPCAVAAELEAQGVDFTAHVIGFDVSGEDTSGLQCLAEKTGGTYASAEDAGSLSGALREVVEETRTEPILLVALLEEGGEPLDKGVSWEIQAPEPDFEGKHEVLRVTGASMARVPLDNGTYRIVARRGTTRVPVVVDITDESRRVEVILGAGDILMRAALGAETELLTRGVTWRVFEPEPDFEGKYKSVAVSGAPQAKFTLPAGEYRIVAVRDATEVVSRIAVVGGEQTAHRVNLNAGDVKAVATLGPDGEPLKRSVRWEVQSPEPDFEGKHKVIKVSGADQPILTLPEGKYRLVVQRNQARQVKPIEVTAGTQTREVVPMDAGEVIASAHLAAGTDALKRVSWRILEAQADGSGKRAQVGSTGADQPRLTLMSGAYVLVPKRGDASIEHPIEVTAGSQTRVEVAMNAGEVRPRAVDATGEPVRPMSWSIFAVPGSGDNESEQRVGATGADTPTLTLPAGSYRLEARHKRQSVSKRIEVTAGEQQAVEVVVPATAAGG